MTKKQKKMLRRILIAAVLFFPLLILEKTGQLEALLAGMSGGTAGAGGIAETPDDLLRRFGPDAPDGAR